MSEYPQAGVAHHSVHQHCVSPEARRNRDCESAWPHTCASDCVLSLLRTKSAWLFHVAPEKSPVYGIITSSLIACGIGPVFWSPVAALDNGGDMPHRRFLGGERTGLSVQVLIELPTLASRGVDGAIFSAAGSAFPCNSNELESATAWRGEKWLGCSHAAPNFDKGC